VLIIVVFPYSKLNATCIESRGETENGATPGTSLASEGIRQGAEVFRSLAIALPSGFTEAGLSDLVSFHYPNLLTGIMAGFQRQA